MSNYHIEIKVNQHFINRGNPQCMLSCPTALAIRAFGYRKAEVGSEQIMLFGIDSYEGIYQISKKLKEWIEKFDEAKEIPEPFTLILKQEKAYIKE